MILGPASARVWYKSIRTVRYPTLIAALIGLTVAGALPAQAGGGSFSLSEQAGLRGLAYRYDARRRIAEIGEGPSRMSFLAGSRYAWVSGRLRRLKERTRLSQDGRDVWAPEEARAFFEPLGPARTDRPFTVMIDPGHGGKDPGAVAPDGQLEKDVALRIALEIAERLRGKGLRVLLTRSADEYIELQRRPEMANEQGADLLVSVHANASESPSLGGFEIYYLSNGVDDAALAAERAQSRAPRAPSGEFGIDGGASRTIVWDLVSTENRRKSAGMAGHIEQEVGNAVVTEARRVRQAEFRVLKLADCPAVLVEAGYLTHDGDEARLLDPEYRRRLSDAIVEGLAKYIDKIRPARAGADTGKGRP